MEETLIYCAQIKRDDGVLVQTVRYPDRNISDEQYLDILFTQVEKARKIMSADKSRKSLEFQITVVKEMDFGREK